MEGNGQEEFWGAEFGEEYVDRNTDERRIKGCTEFLGRYSPIRKRGQLYPLKRHFDLLRDRQPAGMDIT